MPARDEKTLTRSSPCASCWLEEEENELFEMAWQGRIVVERDTSLERGGLFDRSTLSLRRPPPPTPTSL